MVGVKKTYIKTITREIKESFGRFVAIFAIVALGVGFLAGLLATTPDMQASVDKYYDDSHMADINIKATMGLTNADIEAISSMDEINKVMPAYVTDSLMKTNDNEVLPTRIYGLPLNRLNQNDDGFINQLKLIKGRMPQANNEALVEQKGNFLSEIELGTTMSVSEDNENYGNVGEIYNTTEYTVVGVVSNSQYLSKEAEASKIGNGRIGAIMYVDESNYKLGAYTDVFITASGVSDLNTFKEEYDTQMDGIVTKLEALGKSRSQKTQKWYVLDRNANVSYVSFSINAEKVASIATVFPIFFFLVAALVALTTMTRMVEEERTQIGTLKALGYSKGTIMFKYLVYCGLATVLGSIVGLLVGFRVLPNILWNAYASGYHLPEFIANFSWGLALISSFLAIVCTMVATIWACYHALKEKPSSLMLPRSPKAGKRIFLERIPFIWSRMKFTYKATARNLIRYKKHFFMTVIGIGGCTALIVTGFGLRDSVGDIANTQFNEIFQYDLLIELNGDHPLDSVVNEFIKDTKKVDNFTEISSQTGYATRKNERFMATVYVPKEPSVLKDFVNLRDRRSGKSIVTDKSSVIVTEMLASALGIQKGDTFTLENANGETGKFVLSGIAENYVGSYIYLNQADYNNAFGKAPSYNTLMLNTFITDDSQQDAALTKLLTSDTVSSAAFVSQTKKSYDNLLSSINFVVFALIMAAGGLAIVVIYNLTNINISERRKELATLKVLGFHNKEVGGYIFREIFILSMFGTGVGLLLGMALHAFVVRTSERTDLMFGRSISISSFIASAVITMVFSFIVQLILYRKLKKIEMVDSMKASD
ncbi:putative ABC transport system permease protein [Paenibacillus macquariensis]|uniref:ABC transport system permease protein n=1 Tax=Paenibacillus macquariensis TaxID=948756 RepID=A0ABY1K2Z9_9BACL|nr:putative ABC transport system permease protein [Paenibacillus macquariensis]